MGVANICMMFTMQESSSCILVSSMERIQTTAIPTIGVGRSGNVFKLFYNSDFIEKFDIDTQLSLFKHECLHVAFNHFTIWNGEDKYDSPEMHRIRNIATDLEVNCYIDRKKINEKAGGVWAEDFGFERYEGTREYFAKLLDKSQQSKSDNQSQENNSNENQSSNPQLA